MTLHQKASEAAVSKPAHSTVSPSARLICPSEEIFDQTSVQAELNSLLATASSEREIRAQTVECLTNRQKAGRARIADVFGNHPFRARELTSAYTYLTDCIVATAFEIAITRIHPLHNPTKSERLSVLAVG
ncbi:MAG: [protein-PII] uridylyltransferase, partial [Pseudoruegeria sp.]